MIKGIRGAINVTKDEPLAIYEKTKELLKEIIEVNKLQTEEMISITFSATQDLKTAYPAKAAREMGLEQVPLMCSQEMFVEGSLPRCIRVLVLVNWEGKKEVHHVYLGKAKILRPDLK